MKKAKETSLVHLREVVLALLEAGERVGVPITRAHLQKATGLNMTALRKALGTIENRVLDRLLNEQENPKT